ncbi:MAG TPA: NUDIX domain-containing protein [Candidatus Microsaccharimonas sp.]|nr:NUDIX domain-containing protein [Candidatus Microsaccharimonas sp.]
MKAQDDTVYQCVNGHLFYNNPSAAVAVILLNDAGEVLFAKRAREPAKGKYDLPGGFVDYGETVYEAVKREMREETSLVVGELVLVGSAANIYLENVSTADTIVLAKVWHGQLNPQDDVAALEWKPLHFMLSDEFAWRSQYAPEFEKIKKAVEQT